MTELVILSAVEQLERLLDEKAAALEGAEEQAEGLKSDLTLMLGFLTESARSRSRSHLTSQVREMAHDAKAIIDDACTIIESQELESVCLRLRLRLESIRSRFREASDRIQSGVEDEEDVGRPHQPMTPSEGDDVVGFEEDVEDLIDSVLFYGKEYQNTIMIKGMGGMGKTTLAREVYNDAAVVDGFEHRAWACVSGEVSPEEVLRVLIAQVAELSEDELKMLKGNMHVQSLQQMLRQHLEGTRYFIVLDDVWDYTHMKPVITALPSLGKKSKLLLTGRSSKEMDGVYEFLNLRPLTHEQCWQLFLKIVFTGDQKCPKHLEKLGRKIVKKCNDLPLAIKEVGRQLVKKRLSTSEWEEFMESMDFSETIASLESSYHRLPPKLKSCFVYMSFFKDGTTIRVEKFVQIWTAAEMVTQGEQNYQTMEEIARRCLDELIQESMILTMDTTREDKLKTFYIHGFFHKICISKAEEEINFEILRGDRHYQPPCRPRHRVIYCSRDKFNYSTNQDKHLASLLFRGGGNIDATPSYWKSLELLKILDLEGFGLKSLPETVCELSRLRCLGLRNNYIQELPHTLGHLKNLEVLDIAQNFMVEVSDIIWKIDTLRHLYMSDVICRMPLKIDALENLQTLTYISVDNWEYELSSLEMMINLRKLGIEDLGGNSDVSKLFASLGELRNLNYLTLRGFRYRSMPLLDNLGVLTGLIGLKLDGRLTKLPSADNFPPNIRYLTLVNSCLDEDPMPELEKLSELKFLKLRNAYNGQEMVISEDGFRQLRVLCIEELRQLRNVRVGKRGRNFPLHQLEIYNCPYLENLPEDMISYVWKVSHLYMVTTKNIAKKIRGLRFHSKIYTDIKP